MATVFSVVVFPAVAGSSNSTSIKTGWEYNERAIQWSWQDYLIAGCSDPSNFTPSCHGTYDDEGAIVLNMARKFNDQGAMFCPTQVQFGNTNGQSRIWVNFYEPTDSVGCKWICRDGYKGTNCSQTDDGSDVGTTDFKTLKRASMRTSGGSSNRISSTIDIFDKSEHTSDNSNRGAWVHVLAIQKFLDHGVLAGHMWIYGTRDWGCWGGSCIKSWVTKVHGENNWGRATLLCDKGYKQNAAHTDCVKMVTEQPTDTSNNNNNNNSGSGTESQTPPASTQPAPPPRVMCAGWTEEEFESNKASLDYYKVGDCWQYRCATPGYAFTATQRRCTLCETGVRGGPAKSNGVCMVCGDGQYYNNGECAKADSYYKTDLVYGKNKDKTTRVFDQCWIKLASDKYRECVTGVKQPEAPKDETAEKNSAGSDLDPNANQSGSNGSGSATGSGGSGNSSGSTNNFNIPKTLPKTYYTMPVVAMETKETMKSVQQSVNVEAMPKANFAQ